MPEEEPKIESRQGEILGQPQRSEAEIKSMKERLDFVARVFSGNYDVKVFPADNWSAGIKSVSGEKDKIKPAEKRKPDFLSYRESDLFDRQEQSCFAVLRHEIAHLKHTDFDLLSKGMNLAKGEGFQPSDFQVLFNGIEDPRVDTLETHGAKRLERRMAARYQEDMPQAIELLKKDSPPIQFSRMLVISKVQEFLGGGESLESIVRPEVFALYQKLKEPLSRAMEETAEDSYQVIERDIWPEFKNLIEQFTEEESKAGAEGEEKEKLRQEARNKLNEEESSFNQEYGAKTIEIKEEDGEIAVKPKEINPQDLAEVEEKKEAERAAAEKKKVEGQEQAHQDHLRRAQSLARLRERKEGLTEGERREYENYKRAVAPQIRELEKFIDEVLPPKADYQHLPNMPRGQRIEAKRLGREVATGRGRMFEKREASFRREAAFSLLVDVSGSMQGEKIKSALRSAIMMAEVLDAKGLACEIIVFHSQFLELKRFNQKYGGQEKKKLIGMLKESGSNYAGATDTGFAIDSSAKRLQAERQRLKSGGTLIVITDGQPKPVLEHSGAEWELGGVIEKWQKRLPVIGLGIGSGMKEMIDNYFGRQGVTEENIERQPQALLKILKRELGRMRERK